MTEVFLIIGAVVGFLAGVLWAARSLRAEDEGTIDAVRRAFDGGGPGPKK